MKRTFVSLTTLIACTVLLVSCAPKNVVTDTPSPSPTSLSPSPAKEELAPAGDIVDIEGKTSVPTASASETYNTPGNTPASTDSSGKPNTGNTPVPTATTSYENVVKYTYDSLSADIKALSAKYNIEAEVIGKTKFSRDIFCVKLGSRTAENKILLIAGVRGSEYGNSLLMMKQIETYLTDTSKVYSGMTYDEILKKCRIYFVPMLNPDGVELNINGADGFDPSVHTLVESSISSGYMTDRSGWDANADGIDVSINFGRGTVTSDVIRNTPCCSGYCGTPFTSSEASAIRTLCQNEKFKISLIYSGNGGLIDWSFGQSKSMYVSRQLADKLALLTGYTALSNGLDKDMCISVNAAQWFISEYDLPAFSLMTGISVSGGCSPKSEWSKLALAPIALASESGFNLNGDTEIVDIDD